MNQSAIMRAIGVTIFALVSAAITAKAQTATSERVFARFDFERFNLSTDPNGVGLQDGARPLGVLAYGTSFMLNMQKSPMQLCVKNGSDACDPGADLISSRFSSDLGLVVGFGVADVRLVLPLVLAQYSDFQPVGSADSMATTGMGDPQLGGRVGLWHRDGFAIAGDLSFTLPLNGGASFIGNTGMTAWPRVLGEFRYGPVATSASLGYFWRYKDRRIGDLYVNDEMTWSASAEYAFLDNQITAGAGLNGSFGFMHDPNPTLSASDGPGQEVRPVEGTLGGKFRILPNFIVQAGIGRGLTGGFGMPAVRVLVGVAWNDDLRHLHPRLFGVAPASPADAEVMPAQVTDLTTQPAAQKPTLVVPASEPVKLAEPEPAHLAAPEPTLITEPEPAGTEAAEMGEAETSLPAALNSTGAEPSVVVTKPGEPVIKLSSTKIQLQDRIYFVNGTPKVAPKSIAVLRVVANVLKAHPELRRVRIEGHASRSVDGKFDIWIAAQRAEEVRRFLIGAGVAPARLEAKGFGTSRPLVDPKTKGAGSRNRRVEFVIMERSAP